MCVGTEAQGEKCFQKVGAANYVVLMKDIVI